MTTEPPAGGPAVPNEPEYPPPPGWTLQHFSDGRAPEYAPPARVQAAASTPPYYAQPALGAYPVGAYGASTAQPARSGDSMGGAAIAGLALAAIALPLAAVPTCGLLFIGLGLLFSAMGLFSRKLRIVAIIGLAVSLLAMGLAIWTAMPH